MKMIFLVDGDNNIGTGLQGIDLLTAEDTVLVFFGKGQTLANVKKLCAGTKAQVQYLESVKGGKNSLDFQIITELGVLVGRGEADFAYVISQDKGYEAAMSALHARYASTFREVALRPSIQDCLQAAFLLRAGTREELAAALARQYGPVQGQLAYLMSHDLHDEYTAVGSCCCVDAVDCVGRNVYCTLEAECHVCSPDIIVDGLRQMDDIQAFLA